MIKKITYLIIFLISINIVFALSDNEVIYGGESFNLYEGGCAYLDVNIDIDPYQNLSEYSFNHDYEFIDMGNYRFDCPDNYINLDITPRINSVGEYTVIISIFKEVEEPVSGSSGGSTHFPSVIKEEPKEIIDDIIEDDDEDIILPDKDIPEPSTEPEISYLPLIFIIGGGIILIILIVLLCSQIVKNKLGRKPKNENKK